MGKIIAVLSGKGEVGKTTITALLGTVLARKGYKVLLIDGDMGLRNLDLVLGLQNEVFFDFADMSKGQCLEQDAVMEAAENLYFIAASQQYTWGKIGSAAFYAAVEDLQPQYDFILVDCPAGIGKGYKYAVKAADQILIVTEPTWVSVRDADRIIRDCNKKRIWKCAVLLNNFYSDSETYLSVRQVLDTLLPEQVAGVLPHSEEVVKAAQLGTAAKLPAELPYMQAMEKTAAFCIEETEADIQEWEQYLPSEKKEAAMHAEAETSKETEAERTGLRQRLKRISFWRWNRK